MLDWIFEGIITWVSSVVTDLMDAVSRYVPAGAWHRHDRHGRIFSLRKQSLHCYAVYGLGNPLPHHGLAIIRIFGGPVTDAENPWSLIGRSALFALLIGYAKQSSQCALDIATAPYTALMDIQMTAEDFTFAGVEAMLMNGLTSLIATISVVGLLLLVILGDCIGLELLQATT